MKKRPHTPSAQEILATAYAADRFCQKDFGHEPSKQYMDAWVQRTVGFVNAIETSSVPPPDSPA